MESTCKLEGISVSKSSMRIEGEEIHMSVLEVIFINSIIKPLFV
jgi:hypothetical protein